MSPARIIAAIVGVLLAPAAIALLVGGIALAVVFAANRDDDGYVRTTDYALSSDSYAITSDEIDISPYPGDWWPAGIATARFVVSSAGEEPVFFGLGPADDIADYLDGVAIDEVERLALAVMTFAIAMSPAARQRFRPQIRDSGFPRPSPMRP